MSLKTVFSTIIKFFKNHITVLLDQIEPIDAASSKNQNRFHFYVALAVVFGTFIYGTAGLVYYYEGHFGSWNEVFCSEYMFVHQAAPVNTWEQIDNIYFLDMVICVEIFLVLAMHQMEGKQTYAITQNSKKGLLQLAFKSKFKLLNLTAI